MIFAIASLLPVIGQIACMLLSPLLIYALCYIAFENAEVMDAIKRVFNELVSGDILMAVVVGIVANIIGGLGGLLCGIGVIFTAPLTSIIYYFAYKQMRGGNDDVLDAEIVGETEPSDSDEVETDSGTQQ